jgi:hypothetical protein
MKLLETDIDYVCPEYDSPIDNPLWIIEHEGRIYEVNADLPDQWRFWIYPEEIKTLDQVNSCFDFKCERIDGQPICMQLKAFCKLTS